MFSASESLHMAQHPHSQINMYWVKNKGKSFECCCSGCWTETVGYQIFWLNLLTYSHFKINIEESENFAMESHGTWPQYHVLHSIKTPSNSVKKGLAFSSIHLETFTEHPRQWHGYRHWDFVECNVDQKKGEKKNQSNKTPKYPNDNGPYSPWQMEINM